MFWSYVLIIWLSAGIVAFISALRDSTETFKDPEVKLAVYKAYPGISYENYKLTAHIALFFICIPLGLIALISEFTKDNGKNKKKILEMLRNKNG